MAYARVTLANLLHIFFDSYSAHTQNINVTTLKINIIIKKHTFLGTQTGVEFQFVDKLKIC